MSTSADGVNVKMVFALKHSPENPPLFTRDIEEKMLEAFLYHHSPGNYSFLKLGERNFAVKSEWDRVFGEDAVEFKLKLMLTIFSDESIIIEIPRGSALWRAVIFVSKIKEVDISIPYPDSTLA